MVAWLPPLDSTTWSMVAPSAASSEPSTAPRSSRRESEMRRALVSTDWTRTLSSSPTWTTSRGLLTRCVANWLTWISPSSPGSSSTKAPKSISLVTFPLAMCPSGYL